MSLSYLLHLMPKRSHECSVCQKVLNKQDSVSLLQELQESGLHRKDVCEACYKENVAKEDLFEEVSVWRPQNQQAPKQKNKKVSTDSKALELLRINNTQNSPESKKEAFILALHLIRRKKSRFRKQIDVHGEAKGLFEVPSTGEELILDLWAELSGIDTEFQKNLLSRLSEDTP